jgi:hypothetical protein
MDLGAALLVLAAPNSNQACHGPRTRSLSASPTSVRSGFSQAVHRQGGPVLSCGPRTEGSWMSVETSTVQQAQRLTIDLHNPHQDSMREAALTALTRGPRDSRPEVPDGVPPAG